MNPWVEHVKRYCVDHNCSYRQGLRLASPSYKKQRGGGNDFSRVLMKATKTKKYDNPAVNIIGKAGEIVGKTNAPFAKETSAVLSGVSQFLSLFPRDKITLQEAKKLGRLKRKGDKKGLRKLTKKIQAR